jgi:hypothetical protein
MVDEYFFLSLLPLMQASEHTNEQKEEKKKMQHSRWPTRSAYREKCNLIIVV